MATVTLEKLVKRYGPVEAVRAIDLEIFDGEFVALVGPSGCGKSTTLRMIAGLEEISGGFVRIGDEVVNDLPPRARNISMVFQSYALYPHMSVRENMAFSLKIAKRPAGRDRPPRRRGERHPSPERAARPPPVAAFRRPAPARRHGPRDRAQAAKSSCSTSRCPTSTPSCARRCAPRSSACTRACPASTVIYVTHDQVEAMTLADRIVIMRDGHIEQVGTPDEVFHTPATRFVAGFIGSPAMNLVEATILDGKVQFAGGDFLPLPDKFKNAVSAGQRIVFGMRPDDVHPTGHGLPSAAGEQAAQRELRVSVTEPLGNETLVFAPFGGVEWIARMLNPIPLEPGRAVRMTFDLAKAHLFAAEGGHAIARA